MGGDTTTESHYHHDDDNNINDNDINDINHQQEEEKVPANDNHDSSKNLNDVFIKFRLPSLEDVIEFEVQLLKKLGLNANIDVQLTPEMKKKLLKYVKIAIFVAFLISLTLVFVVTKAVVSHVKHKHQHHQQQQENIHQFEEQKRLVDNVAELKQQLSQLQSRLVSAESMLFAQQNEIEWLKRDYYALKTVHSTNIGNVEVEVDAVSPEENYYKSKFSSILNLQKMNVDDGFNIKSNPTTKTTSKTASATPPSSVLFNNVGGDVYDDSHDKESGWDKMMDKINAKVEKVKTGFENIFSRHHNQNHNQQQQQQQQQQKHHYNNNQQGYHKRK